jgi:hypothetical protein
MRTVARWAFAAVLAAGGAAALAQTQEGVKPAQIDRNGVVILIRSTMVALDQANKTGNYTVLRDLGAPGFRANSDARLAELFANLRRSNIDLSGVLVLEPQLSELPQLDKDGMMHLAGIFPSMPAQINFNLAYAPVNGQWRLFGISVGLGQTAPAAPQQPAAAAKSDASPPALKH